MDWLRFLGCTAVAFVAVGAFFWMMMAFEWFLPLFLIAAAATVIGWMTYAMGVFA